MPSLDNPDSPLETLRAWVELESGMKFTGGKLSRLQSAVKKVLGRDGDFTDVELNDVLAHPKRRSVFLERLSAELTIGESYFFRNKHHFQALRQEVFPRILRENTKRKEIRIWSAGCAGGEEPYSLAILLDQILNGSAAADRRSTQGARPASRIGDYLVHILATDLNTEFLDRARQGHYRQWSFRQTEINRDQDYFTAQGNDFCLAAHIRHLVRFAVLNLVKDVYPSPLTGTFGLDLIVFRNVAIYLKAEVSRAILQRFCRALRPGGWLLLGETEVGTLPSNGFRVHRFGEATFFRKSSVSVDLSDDPLPMPTPPLAAFVSQPSAQSAIQSEPPDWVPLPISDKLPARTTGISVEDEIHHLLQQGNYGAAERSLDRIAGKSDRARTRLRYLRGLLARSEVARAREMLDQCLAEEPLLVEAQLLKATFAEEDGDLAEAEHAYRRALYIDRKCTIAHFLLGLVQQKQGDLTGARRSLKIAYDLACGGDVHAIVPYGDGVCHGRLQELIEEIADSSN